VKNMKISANELMNSKLICHAFVKNRFGLESRKIAADISSSARNPGMPMNAMTEKSKKSGSYELGSKGPC
jgi:hypothetical protein